MTSACGIDCETCELKVECGGCPPGTDPRVKDRLEELKKSIGFICPVLRCAMEKKVEYCLKCAEFPCAIHYKYNYPYSDLFLDSVKVMKERRKDFGGEEFRKEVLKITLEHLSRKSRE
jgi:hypothetical protein